LSTIYKQDSLDASQATGLGLPQSPGMAPSSDSTVRPTNQHLAAERHKTRCKQEGKSSKPELRNHNRAMRLVSQVSFRTGATSQASNNTQSQVAAGTPPQSPGAPPRHVSPGQKAAGCAACSVTVCKWHSQGDSNTLLPVVTAQHI
jgi:nucleoprotein TPR